MKKIISFRFSLILFIIGLMTAIQYNTLNEPNSRDTRDVWEVRQELSREKQLHSELLSEIGLLSETLSKYEFARGLVVALGADAARVQHPVLYWTVHRLDPIVHSVFV